MVLCFLFREMDKGVKTWLGLECGIVRVYGGLRLCHTMFTWYGHKILVYIVLTVAISDLHYSTLHLQRQCLI